MYGRILIGALAIALGVTIADAQVFDTSKYPDLRGQWTRAGAAIPEGDAPFDPSKPPGRGQQPPLTPEYQAIFEANLREREAGVPGTWPGPTCLPPGMPATMTAYEPMEIIILPKTTYIRIDYIRETRRRIFTDGRDWPAHAEPGFDGYSIGRWADEDRDGKFDVLEAETRNFKGPRAFDLSGIPLHKDNKTVIEERIYLDKVDKDLLHNEMTVTDNALTRPWAVKKSYRRSANQRPEWNEHMCNELTKTMKLGGETYLLSREELLMPAKKDQKPPDLKYFSSQR